MQPLCEFCGSPVTVVKVIANKKSRKLIVKCVGCGARKEIVGG